MELSHLRCNFLVNSKNKCAFIQHDSHHHTNVTKFNRLLHILILLKPFIFDLECNGIHYQHTNFESMILLPQKAIINLANPSFN
jgi:hypothetical protein